MELRSVDIARSLWFGHMVDFNPRGMALSPITLSPIAFYLANIYKFKKLPPPNADLGNADGVKFEDGEFVFKGDEPPVSVTLTLYQEGLTADTRFSTECSDAFLIDLFTRITKDFKIPPYEGIIHKKRYFSQLYISIIKSFSVINPKLQEIATFLSKNTEAGEEIIFEFGGVSFWPEQTAKWIPSAFTIERVVNVPFSENRYFSRAALQTEKHIELLNKLENILS
jgi:hypothetical protein